ncbi:hypothetical protein FCOIX_8631 [Fusarium coicis]|nr:hypothetical protein FCOIX_8631 [Fusarium coicis]
MDEGHKYTPGIDKTVSQTTPTSETSKPSSDTTAVTETSTTSSGSVTEATAEVPNGNRSELRSDTGAIVGGVVGGLAVEVCAEAGDDTRDGKGMAVAPGQTGTDNGPKELVGSKPSDVPANRQTAEFQGPLTPRQPGPVELPYNGVTRELGKVSDRKR